MSMLTEQTKKLRKAAYEVENINNGTIGLLTRDRITLVDAAKQMREAADTIADLRLQLMDQTCHNVAECREDLVCSMCGCYVECIEPDWSYCPRCGRQVVE